MLECHRLSRNDQNNGCLRRLEALAEVEEQQCSIRMTGDAVQYNENECSIQMNERILN